MQAILKSCPSVRHSAAWNCPPTLLVLATIWRLKIRRLASLRSKSRSNFTLAAYQHMSLLCDRKWN
jgi:hypothetical protein